LCNFQRYSNAKNWIPRDTWLKCKLNFYTQDLGVLKISTNIYNIINYIIKGVNNIILRL
jgi:hypothetical protein